MDIEEATFNKKNKILLRRALMGFLNGVFLYITYLILYYLKYFRTTFNQFVILSIIMGTISSGFILIIYKGWNQKFKDTSLTIPILIWCDICILGGIYLSYHLREIILTQLLIVVTYGSFRLRPSQFFILSLITMIGTLICYSLIYFFHPQFINVNYEITNLIIFGFLLSSASSLASQMSKFRCHLKINNNKLEKALKQIELLSEKDELTQVKNRKYIMEVLEKQLSLATRDPHYFFSIGILDIDYFKRINDEYGHLIGDIVLMEFCKIITSSLRNIDYFGRIGGEEFMLVSPSTNKKNMKILIEKIRINLENTTISHGELNLRLTTSIGFTEYKVSDSVKDMLIRADKGLYKAKEQGRNQAVFL
ncbi:MAG: hypothetical protein JWM09_1551 [Francisellaceae bacterium]|nr:hypothetical protein [Francisellaceae bacterium]